ISFQREESLLAPQPAAVARKRAVRADDAMAGHDDRDRIGPVGRADGTHGPGLADLARDGPVRLCLAPGNGFQRLPDAALKVGPRRRKRKLKAFAPPGKILLELR